MEKQIKMEKLKVAFKENEFKAELETYSKFLPVFNEILESYNSLGFHPLDDITFKSLLVDSKSVLFQLLTAGEKWSLGGLQISNEKAFELLELPVGVEALILQISQVKQSHNFAAYLSYSELVDGEIVLQPSLVKKVRERNTIYAKSEKSQAAVKFIQDVLKLKEQHFGDTLVDLNELISRSIQMPYSSTVDQNYILDWSYASTFREVW